MSRIKYQIIRDKKITNSYCKEFSVLEIIEVLRYENKSPLWDKIKINWKIEDWQEFFKLKIDNYDN
jgi:hypothetical protein